MIGSHARAAEGVEKGTMVGAKRSERERKMWWEAREGGGVIETPKSNEGPS